MTEVLTAFGGGIAALFAAWRMVAYYEKTNREEHAALMNAITALSGRIGSVETKLTERIGVVETKLTERIGAIETKLTERVGAVERGIGERVASVEAKLDALIAGR